MTRKVPPSPSAVTTTATFQHGSICHARNGVFCNEEKTINTCPGQSTENVHFNKSCLNSTVIGILATPKMHMLFVAVITFHTSDYGSN
jgi:hypothetical protein